MRARTHTRTHARTHTERERVVGLRKSLGMELKKVVVFKRKVCKEDLEELTQVELRIEIGSWFQIIGTW